MLLSERYGISLKLPTFDEFVAKTTAAAKKNNNVNNNTNNNTNNNQDNDNDDVDNTMNMVIDKNSWDIRDYIIIQDKVNNNKHFKLSSISNNTTHNNNNNNNKNKNTNTHTIGNKR
eukprot:UN04832